jgi:septum site-determining protein MinC
MTDHIIIKGISQGILITLPEQGKWPNLSQQLLETINQRAAFFKGGQLILDVREREVSESDLRSLLQALETISLTLAGVLSSASETLSAAQTLDLATDLASIPPPTRPTRETPAALSPNDPDYQDPSVDSEEYGTSGVLIKRTLRSGRTIRSMGHVVVIGDVNSGAEIIAVGDVIVWGKLRGTVHAGAQGDENAVVCALDLAPLQLRIAGLITVPPRENRRTPQPEMAHINEGRIEAVPWQP